ncbi:hypothetical protein QBC40DRAFT_341004 [Triangularia verruculosa]|uniref:ubiquitinyl hydrolase 1 n=1 Tax=Triangularia verruculosa TaxID=2587418 RepID=A0AAN7ARV3_9PEZI|nr:hypothetical protein QBC40DRAFT_341004 [Triangularia verruculosa]
MPVIETIDALNNGGRLATRLIEDLYNGVRQHAGKSDPKTQSCFVLRGTRIAPPGVSDDHDLIELPSQTHVSGDQAVISCLCKYCRYHFTFKCPSRPPVTGPEHLQHHFVFVENSDELFGEEHGRQILGPVWDKRRAPVVRQTKYRCTACDFTLQVEVTAPRLDSRWIDIVTDESRAKRNLKRAMAEDPARFQDMTADKLAKLESGALITLNMYITNIMANDSILPDKNAEKKISERNKTFMVQFGPECEDLFLYLGFKKRQESEEAFYISPREPPQEGGKTDLYTERAFFEDVKSEIQSVIDQKFPQHVQPHSSARRDLEKALGCADVTKLSVVLHLKPDDQHYYYLLGASPSSTDDMLKWAYQRQIALDPDHRRYYIDALSKLAYAKGVDLQLFAVAEHEPPAPSSSATTRATSQYAMDWEWFGFERAVHRALEKGEILDRYREYIEDRPYQRGLHRLHLAKIGRDLQQQDLVEVAVHGIEEKEAYQILDVPPEADLDSIANTVWANIQDSDKDLAVVVAAMNFIGEKHEHMVGTHAYAEFEVITGKLHARLNGEAETEDPENVFGVGIFAQGTPSNQGTEPAKDGDPTLPAGLANLRNTCYLNSILQYLYTVDIIRDLLRNLDLDTPLEASTEKIGEILGEVTESAKKDAWLGFEFARELRTLFQEMEQTTSVHVKPRQRLANAVFAKAADGSKAAESKTTESKATESPAAEMTTESKEVPPPLPPRNGEEATTEHVETASMSSSQTLVGDVAAKKEGTAGKKTQGPVEVLANVLDNEEVRGTNQEDVDEAMGFILGHLQEAVNVARALSKAQGENREEQIPDPIKDHIYTEFVNTRKEGDGQWRGIPGSERFLRVPPHSTMGVKTDLYQAIGQEMDAQLSEEPKSRYFTAIRKPADILHFLFSRSRQGGKNENPIELNDPLYLDHFMEAEDFQDERFRRNTRLWAINRRLEELRVSKEKLETEPNPEGVLSEEDMERFLKEDLPFDIDGDYELVDVNEGTAKEVQEITVSPDMLKEFGDWLSVEEASEEQKLRAEREAILNDPKLKMEYRLHAVFCHRGSTGAGHYWAWIKDFERGVWRKYNDTTVTLFTEEEFRREVGCASEPCWAAYVRAGKEKELVSIPMRKGVDKSEVEVKVKDVLAKKAKRRLSAGNIKT